MSTRDLHDEAARAYAHESGSAAYEDELEARHQASLAELASSPVRQSVDARFRLEERAVEGCDGERSMAGAARVRTEQGSASDDGDPPGYDKRLYGWRESEEQEDALRWDLPRSVA